MAEPVHATTRLRNNKVLQAYDDVIAEYGETAKQYTKKFLYDEVAKRTQYTSSYVQILITKNLRHNECRKKK